VKFAQYKRKKKKNPNTVLPPLNWTKSGKNFIRIMVVLELLLVPLLVDSIFAQNHF